jgi:alpha-ketoglutarate-dependent taurine dioxygenase
MAKVTVEPIKEHIGARILMDRADLLAPEVTQACLAALEDRGAIVFPQLNLSDAEQVAFTDALGERVNFTKNAPGGSAAEQDVYKITLDPEINQHQEYVLGTFFWHVDGATMPMPLPKATLLSGRTLSDKGGQTEFANLYAAYEHLPDSLKADYADLRVLHTIGSSMREVVEEVNEESVVLLNTATKMTHPLVWKHKSGRKSLLLGSHADRIIDMPLAQGRALIRRLTEWAAQPDFTYSHDWEPGDFVIWDNCGVMHRVVPYEDPRRTMHRTTLAGTEMVG